MREGSEGWRGSGKGEKDGEIWDKGREGWGGFGEARRDAGIWGGSKGSLMLEWGTVGRGNLTDFAGLGPGKASLGLGKASLGLEKTSQDPAGQLRGQEKHPWD